VCFIFWILSAVVPYADATFALRCQFPVREHLCRTGNDWIPAKKPQYDRPFEKSLVCSMGALSNSRGDSLPENSAPASRGVISISLEHMTP
jgi:hypothetical protein